VRVIYGAEKEREGEFPWSEQDKQERERLLNTVRMFPMQKRRDPVAAQPPKFLENRPTGCFRRE
jgi:hypothetical protein